jgi:CheY-like chemotaxis protein/HPt (histidine-containing phosphotransfer) domain-containing protein
LLVEDNLINQEVALDLLREVGIRADIAGNGQEAVEKVRRHDYELILMDVQMPVMDGLAATEAIRRLPGYAAVPILAMTASVFVEEQNLCLKAGMNDLVPKPVDPEALFAALAKWLPERRQREQAGTHAASVEVAVEGLRAALEEIDGLDVAAGLRSLRGKLASYARLLRKFALSHSKDVVLMRDAFRAGDHEAARLLAHTLKGIAGTLGATRLQSQAAAMEQAIGQAIGQAKGQAKGQTMGAATPDSAENAEFERLCMQAELELAGLAAALLAALPAEGEPGERSDVGAAVQPDAQLAIKRLQDLLDADDMHAVTALREIQPLLAQVISAEPLASLAQQVEGYDLHAAAATLRKATEPRP